MVEMAFGLEILDVVLVIWTVVALALVMCYVRACQRNGNDLWKTASYAISAVVERPYNALLVTGVIVPLFISVLVLLGLEHDADRKPLIGIAAGGLGVAVLDCVRSCSGVRLVLLLPTVSRRPRRAATRYLRLPESASERDTTWEETTNSWSFRGRAAASVGTRSSTTSGRWSWPYRACSSSTGSLPPRKTSALGSRASSVGTSSTSSEARRPRASS